MPKTREFFYFEVGTFGDKTLIAKYPSKTKMTTDEIRQVLAFFEDQLLDMYGY